LTTALFKYRAGVTKYLIKKLAEGKVHRDIIDRKKMGSPSDIRYRLASPESPDTIEGLVSGPDSIAKTELDYGVVSDIVETHYSGRRDYSPLLWMLFSLEWWNLTVLHEHSFALPAGERI